MNSSPGSDSGGAITGSLLDLENDLEALFLSLT